MSVQTKDTDYAFAVARIRANESSLLSSSDIEQLITTEDYQSAIRLLEEKGWMNSDNKEDIGVELKRLNQKTWQLLCEITPDIHELEFLIVKNDFHNIKAALKAFVSEQTSSSTSKETDSYVVPSIVEPEMIKKAVYNKKYDELPTFAREAASKTYEVLIRSLDGQIVDIMLDAMALETIVKKAQSTGNSFIMGMAELMGVTANIKTALRAARTGKERQFLDTALCETNTLNKEALIEAAVGGQDELINYLANSSYAEASEMIKASTTAFEKWCDDIMMNYVKNARYICLGVEPIIAYYIAKDAEIKTIRIILSCKHNKLPPETIKERVRKLYV